jgi:hypothetical protein
MDIKKLIDQIKFNCNLSDARFWGYYSICGLLLRMRELYKSEKGLKPWERVPADDVSRWIGERERLWQSLETEDFQSIEIDDRKYDPFEVEAINKLLNREGFLYGAGLGTFGKPTFFLSLLKEKREILDYNLFIAGDELCRDLSTSIAMLQGICIFLRTEPLGIILWEKVEEMRSRNFKGLLDRAFSFYRIGNESGPSILYEDIKTIADDISEIFIYHEVGEAVEDRYPQLQGLATDDRWLELHLRGIKDLLADTSDRGPLKLIIERRDERLLCFYLLFLDGIRRSLFPEAMNSFQDYSDSGDWMRIEEARLKGYDRAKGLMEDISGFLMVREDLSSIKEYLTKRLQGLNIKS